MNNNQFSFQRNANMVGGIGGLILLAALLLVIAFTSMVTVEAGYRGVKTRFGKVSGDALSPGLHFRLPGVERITQIETREQKLQLETSASSKDLQTVNSKIAVNFHPVKAAVTDLYSGIGLDYQNRVLEPAVEETVKAITAKYTAEELISKRTVVRDEMETELSKRVEPNFIDITKFNIVNFEFSQSFNEAIESKQTAEQQALRAENDFKRIEVEARQEIEKARGRAESIKLEAQAKADAIRMQAEAEAAAQEMLAKVVDKDVIMLRAIEKWDGIMPRVAGEAIPMLNLDMETE